MNNICKCGFYKFFNQNYCCINCEINNTHNYLCTQYISHVKNNKIFYKKNLKDTNPHSKDNKIKTLFGKDDYLFLINSTGKSLENHCMISKKINISNLNKYTEYIYSNKILFFMFPDKEIICNNFLPDNYKILNRDKLVLYKLQFSELFYDSSNLFDVTDFYKTDSHINLKGMIKFYYKFCSILSKKINISINVTNIRIQEKIVIGNGDLLQGINIGRNIAKKIDEIEYYTDYNVTFINTIYNNDTYYNKDSNIIIYDVNLVNVSEKYDKKKLYFNDISDKILYSNNQNIKSNYNKVLIFYDSFLASTLNLYLCSFPEVYMIKSIFEKKYVELINPDFLLEFRIERFLI